ncbi:MAG: N-acetylmuramic acid 6-phosphate etherase [Streptosporangiales bacterium]|nr:N-acetylmuramic acid 6-phosphate etherase [Streptosporangiales bacterium]
MRRSEHAAARVDSPTERRNPRTVDIDRVSTTELLRMISAEDALVPVAVAGELHNVAHAVELAVTALRSGGRLHYFGAGSSGRIAAMDAAELPPTYGVPPELVVAHHAGGGATLDRAAEDVEDDEDLGRAEAAEVGPLDVAVGLAASGRTPYVLAALATARVAGARTVLISGNPGAPAGRLADVHIAVDTGPEVIAGSTRMKAGTAAKLVLNAFSTAVMVRLGRTYSNLMVGMHAGNSKLRGRGATILAEATGTDPESVAAVLERAEGDTRVALVSLLCGVDTEEAARAVVAAGGVVREAVRLIGGDRTTTEDSRERGP